MKYYSLKDFETNCPCAFSIISYAEEMRDNGTKMDFDSACQSPSNENCYTANFSFYPLYSINQCKLYEIEIKCTISDNQHRCELVKKVHIPSE